MTPYFETLTHTTQDIITMRINNFITKCVHISQPRSAKVGY